MFRALLRALIVIVIVVGAIAFFLGYRYAGGRIVGPAERGAVVGTAGRGEDRDRIATAKARERGAAAGEKIAAAGNRAAEVLSDAALTAKIKSKMALDDSVKALDIDVTTREGNVTLSGDVHSEKARERALALARETEGVRTVTDHLHVR